MDKHTPFNFIGSIAGAETLAHNMLHTTLPTRWQHTQGVARTATTLAHALPLTNMDRVLLICAAWLHDIGYATPTAHNWHPLDGALLLRGMELDLVANHVAWHTTAAEEAAYLGLTEHLHAFPEPGGIVADALTYADMSTGPDGSPVTFEQRLREVEHRRGVESFQAVTMRQAWSRLGRIRATIDTITRH